jgi:hypothetical protein
MSTFVDERSICLQIDAEVAIDCARRPTTPNRGLSKLLPPHACVPDEAKNGGVRGIALHLE